jgi:hypothetical protein
MPYDSPEHMIRSTLGDALRQAFPDRDDIREGGATDTPGIRYVVTFDAVEPKGEGKVEMHTVSFEIVETLAVNADPEHSSAVEDAASAALWRLERAVREYTPSPTPKYGYLDGGGVDPAAPATATWKGFDTRIRRGRALPGRKTPNANKPKVGITGTIRYIQTWQRLASE